MSVHQGPWVRQSELWDEVDRRAVTQAPELERMQRDVAERLRPKRNDKPLVAASALVMSVLSVGAGVLIGAVLYGAAELWAYVARTVTQ